MPKKGAGGTAGFDKATVAGGGGGGCAWSTGGIERAPKAADPLSRALSPRLVTAMRVVCISVGWGVVFLAFFGRFFSLAPSLARRLHCIQLNRSREYWGYGVVFWGGRHRCSLCVNCGRHPRSKDRTHIDDDEEGSGEGVASWVWVGTHYTTTTGGCLTPLAAGENNDCKRNKRREEKIVKHNSRKKRVVEKCCFFVNEIC